MHLSQTPRRTSAVQRASHAFPGNGFSRRPDGPQTTSRRRSEPRPACPRSVPCRTQPRCRAGRGCPGREAGLVGRDRTHGCGRSRLLVPGNETTQLRAGKRRRDTWVVDQKGLYFGNEATSPSASRCSPAGLSQVHRRREGRRSLSPPLARGIKPRCRPLTATLPTRTPRATSSARRCSRPARPESCSPTPRGSGRWCRRCRTSPSHFGGATLLSFPGAETRGDGNNRRRKGYARDTRMMSLRPPASRRPSATCGCRGPCPAEPCARRDRRPEHDGTGRLVSHFERVTFSSARLSIARATETAALPEDSVL